MNGAGCKRKSDVSQIFLKDTGNTKILGCQSKFRAVPRCIGYREEWPKYGVEHTLMPWSPEAESMCGSFELTGLGSCPSSTTRLLWDLVALHDLSLSFLPNHMGMKTGLLQKVGKMDETMLERYLEQSSEGKCYLNIHSYLH